MKVIDYIDKKILSFLSEHEEVELSLTRLQHNIWLDHPQKVAHRLKQLEKKWYLRKWDEGYKVFFEPVKDIIELPIYWSAQCWNKWRAILDEYSREKITFSSQFLNITWDYDDYFFVRARWDSMNPSIFNNDLVLVNQQLSRNENDKVLIMHNWLPKIKKLLNFDGNWYLVSLNPDHEKIKVNPNDNSNIIGVVKKVIRDL